MSDLDIRDTFCTPLLALIEKNTEEGYAYIHHREVQELIVSATKHRDEFFHHFTDEEVARIASDTRIDWQRCFVSSDNSTRNETIFSHVLLHMEMDEYVSWLPLTQAALNQRYSPTVQVEILKQSQAMPGYNGSIIDARQMLSGRIIPLILQDDEHLNAWTDEWMKGLKYQERVGPNLSKSFSETVNVTKAYKKLKDGETSLDALSVLMPFAGLINPEPFMRSVGRYCQATLYELSNGEHSGHFFNVRDDYLRRTLVYGLYLLKGEGLEELVSLHIGRQVIHDKHIDLSAALLASSVNWHKELIDVEDLAQIKAKYETRTAIDQLLSQHAFGWDRDWFKKLSEVKHCEPLRDRVATFESFRRWVMDYASNSRYASMSSMKQLPSWIDLMDEQAREQTFKFLVEKFEEGITVKNSPYKTGIFYGKVLLSAFPDDEFAQACISNQVGYLVKRALKDDHTELLAAVIAKGFVTPEMVGRCLWSVAEFDKLTKSGNLTKKLLLPFVKRQIKVGVLENDMGL